MQYAYSNLCIVVRRDRYDSKLIKYHVDVKEVGHVLDRQTDKETHQSREEATCIPKHN